LAFRGRLLGDQDLRSAPNKRHDDHDAGAVGDRIG
jgi:hypothetical protein